MKNCFHGDYFKSYLTVKPGIFFSFFTEGIHGLDILDTSLLLRYTIRYTLIAHSV